MNRFKNSMIARHRKWIAISALLIAVGGLSFGARLMKAQETGPPLGQTRVINFGPVTVARNQAVQLNALKAPSAGVVTVNLKIRHLPPHGSAQGINMLVEKAYLLDKDVYSMAQADITRIDLPPDRPDKWSITIFATVTITGGDTVDQARVIPTLEVIDKDTGRTSILYPAPPSCDPSGEPCNDQNDVNH